ncbi:MAG: ATP-binding protein [Bacillus subtilis]|nr:ATP-binding protein [Bacillus subtilis]
MYIGSTGPRGLHHLVWEIVDNADRRSAGRLLPTSVELEILSGNDRSRVEDNGRGIPVDVHPKSAQAGRRNGVHHPARGRQVRPSVLQSLRRPPRRRRFRRRTRFPNRSRSKSSRTARSIGSRFEHGVSSRNRSICLGDTEKTRHDRHLPRRPGSLPGDAGIRLRNAAHAHPAVRLFEQGHPPHDQGYPRPRQDPPSRIQVRRRRPRIRRVPELRQGAF